MISRDPSLMVNKLHNGKNADYYFKTYLNLLHHVSWSDQVGPDT